MNKGFHTGSELKKAQDLGIETIVAITRSTIYQSGSKTIIYNYEYFRYDNIADTYTCPQRIRFSGRNGSWYKESRAVAIFILFKQYKRKHANHVRHALNAQDLKQQADS